jgi:hypothetical protein
MRGMLRKPDFRGTAASMPIRHDTFTGTLGWACILAVAAMGLLLCGCPEPPGGGGGGRTLKPSLLRPAAGRPFRNRRP